MELDVNELNNMIQKSIFEETNKVGNLVFQNLLPNGPQNFIPESVFRDYFLPRFLGIIDTPRSSWVVEWISIAGSPTAEVGITHDTSKELLYVVPALLYTNNLGLAKNSGDLGDIFKRYKQIIINLPQNGTSFLMEALHHKNQEYLSSLDITLPEAQWLEIMIRYGIIDLSGQENSSGALVEDMFDFD